MSASNVDERRIVAEAKAEPTALRRWGCLLIIACVVGGLGFLGARILDLFVPLRTLVYPGFEELGFTVEIDEPDYAKFMLTNTGSDTAQNVTLVVREDYSYANDGYTSQRVLIGDMKPQEARTLSYRYNSPNGYDIGQLEIWLECHRGKAYEITRWSYASF